jgi:uncharacterized protein (DUF952 family)
MIFHVTDAGRWQQSLQDGAHTGSTRGVELAEQGFIHCSTAAQWPGVIARFYAGVADLVLLHIDEARLTSPLRYEAAAHDSAGEVFPHVYGPIDLAAVVLVEPLV